MAQHRKEQSGSESKSGSKSQKKINLNNAGLEELAMLPMVGRGRAQDILNYRDEHGPFKDWEDLGKIPGISKGMIEDMKNGGAVL